MLCCVWKPTKSSLSEEHGELDTLDKQQQNWEQLSKLEPGNFYEHLENILPCTSGSGSWVSRKNVETKCLLKENARSQEHSHLCPGFACPPFTPRAQPGYLACPLLLQLLHCVCLCEFMRKQYRHAMNRMATLGPTRPVKIICWAAHFETI